MTEPPFPPRQAAKTARPRKSTKQPKIINGVAYYGFSHRKEPAPSTAIHALRPEGSKK